MSDIAHKDKIFTQILVTLLNRMASNSTKTTNAYIKGLHEVSINIPYQIVAKPTEKISEHTNK